jgi:hypothetical protein
VKLLRKVWAWGEREEGVEGDGTTLSVPRCLATSKTHRLSFVKNLA